VELLNMPLIDWNWAHFFGNNGYGLFGIEQVAVRHRDFLKLLAFFGLNDFLII
jgi:hypothetical protein